MTSDSVQYLSSDKLALLEKELRTLREEKIPSIAKRIDDARQMGDLSENAEYHMAREEMSWAQSRAQELDSILQNVQVIGNINQGNTIAVGSTFTVFSNGKTKEFTIVGAQEAEPLLGKISNESPLGQAFLGKKKGDVVEVVVPAGKQTYEVISIKR